MCNKSDTSLKCERKNGDKGCDSDIIVPPFASDQRCSSIVVAIFNLVATIVGGGALSLPLAFEKCGIIPATVLMVFSALATDRSLYLLCLCSKYTGATSFGELARITFGPWMECAVSLLLFVFLLFVIVAFMVLVRDIWTPVVNALFSSDLSSNIILFIIVVLMSPFLTRRTLHALRYNCYFGFASASILCAGICHRTWQDGTTTEVKLVASSIEDALYGFPIITLGFLSSYNILPVYSSLIRPTNARIGYVINGAMGSSFLVTYIFGLVGYLYFGSSVRGNILNNFDHLDDWTILLGRFGYGITLMLALAIVTVPCRDNILEVMDRLRGFDSNYDETIKDPSSKELNVDEESYLLHQNEKHRQTLLPLAENVCVHYGSTFLIVSSCFVCAVAVPGVDVVWSLCGSCMAFLLSFILPTVFYLRIYSQQQIERPSDFIGSTGISYSIFSWGLMCFAIVGAVACTVQSARTFL